ncbi:unnamed protein product [Clonostachys byssicola]|uniref:Probable succinyl-diaminopimelate desuccinylase n=1 Tax=Clonostachys byssicola TaxID=160290 RepID=A0A9N9U691_9HYPO|nr:unnamed protein product [Clonostachys byssicola]
MDSLQPSRRPPLANTCIRGHLPARPCGADSNKTRLVVDFYQQIEAQLPLRLVNIPQAARIVGLGHVYATQPMGLSWKELSISWAVFRAVTVHLDIPLDSPLSNVKNAISAQAITLVAAVDEAYALGVASAARLLTLPAKLHVSGGITSPTVRDRIRSEGAEPLLDSGTVVETIAAAKASAARINNAIFQDFLRFSEPNATSRWIVEGFSPFLQEVDKQLRASKVDLVVIPVGAGLLAEAVISHFHDSVGHGNPKILSVEPDTAACLWKSLEAKALVTTGTAPTIMGDLRRGEIADDSWDILRNGIDVAVTVSDFEAHQAILDLEKWHVQVGPSSAATLAALRLIPETRLAKLGLSSESTAVLLCTEGPAAYTVPHFVQGNDPVALTQTLVQIDSSSSTISTIPGPGETQIAHYVTAWMEHRNIESHWIEPVRGHPSVVGVVRGTGGGKSLLFNGHLDTVTLKTYEGEPLSGVISDGKLFGRGSADMKGGLAAAMVALASAKSMKIRGDVLLTAVADEEGYSVGTSDVLSAGWRADAALVNEPTNMEILHVHKGFALLEVNIYGVAAHGSRPDLGVDAICKAGYFLAQLDQFAHRLQHGQGSNPKIGPGSIHASIIKGGEEVASYPHFCNIILERRTVPGETPAIVEEQVRDILQSVADSVADFKFDLKLTFHRPPFELSLDHPFFKLVKDVVSESTGSEAVVAGAPYWTDSALLAAQGIPSLIWGPTGYGLHGKEEWVEIESVGKVATGLSEIIRRFCE